MPLDDPRGQLVGHAVERAAVDCVLEPRQRRLRRQALARNRVSVEQQLVDGVVGETVAIIAVGMAAGDAKDALADQVRERVTGLVRRPLVEQTPGERLDQAVDALGGLQQDRPAVGTGLLLVEPGEQRLVKQIREQNSLWYSVGRHARASVVAQVVVNTALVPHGALVSVPESEHATNFPGFLESRSCWSLELPGCDPFASRWRSYSLLVCESLRISHASLISAVLAVQNSRSSWLSRSPPLSGWYRLISRFRASRISSVVAPGLTPRISYRSLSKHWFSSTS